jgi:hypothetical protein
MLTNSLFPVRSSGSGTSSGPPGPRWLQKIRPRVTRSIPRKRIRDRAHPKRRTSRPATDTPSRHLASVCPANEQDVRPHDIRPNRNAARENGACDRSLHSNLADRTRSFFPNPEHDVSDDPRTGSPVPDSGKFDVSHADARANDAIVPDELHALFRCIDTAVVLSTTASDVPPPGTLHCNSGSEHTTAGNGSRSLSAGSIATRYDKRVLANSNVLKDPEEGPRELLSRKVKSRTEGHHFSPRRLFPHRHHPPSTTRPSTIPTPLSSTPVVQIVTINLWLSIPPTLNQVAELS